MPLRDSACCNAIGFQGFLRYLKSTRKTGRAVLNAVRPPHVCFGFAYV